jgi:transcriptional regulator with XRE-family HTH domain
VLRATREEKGLTQLELARRAKVTNVYLSLLESGKKKNPSLDVLKRIAKALGVPVTELLGMRKKKISVVRLADVHLVYRLAMDKALNRRFIPDMLTDAGRDYARQEVTRGTIGKYLDVAGAFERGKPTPKRWAALVEASRKLDALLKARHPRRAKEVSPDDTFSRVLALGGLAHKLVAPLASRKKGGGR